MLELNFLKIQNSVANFKVFCFSTDFNQTISYVFWDADYELINTFYRELHFLMAYFFEIWLLLYNT